MSIAQVLYGSLIGNVTDANGAVVPAASVSATNQGTGASVTGKTDTAGTYQFVNLQPGAYALKVTMPALNLNGAISLLKPTTPRAWTSAWRLAMSGNRSPLPAKPRPYRPIVPTCIRM